MEESTLALLYPNLFQKHPDCLFILVADQLVTANEAAKVLQQQYELDFSEIVAICKGEHCPFHPLKSVCFHCTRQADWQKQPDNPIFLHQENGAQKTFLAHYVQVQAPDTYMLSLREAKSEAQAQAQVQKQQLMEYVRSEQEKERQVLARELHDGLAQSIYSLLLMMRKIHWLKSTEEKQAQLQLLDTGLSELLQEVKQLAQELRPTVLDDLGLIPAIQTLVKRLSQNSEVQILFTTELKEERFTTEIETAVYRILQESLMNSLKHAETKRIEIKLWEEETTLFLYVADQGKGFDYEFVTSKKSGLGLLNMQERAESLGGHIHISSKENQGTKIQVVIPTHKKRGKNHDKHYISR